MALHIIGASGFLGKSLQYVANTKKRKDIIWYSSKVGKDNKYKEFNLSEKSTWKNIEVGKGDKVIYLPWLNLPNYKEKFHLTENMFKSMELFQLLSLKGISKIIGVGTCYEYGLQNGALHEEMEARPVTCYAIAKDLLRRYLEAMCIDSNTEMAWLRVFYPYGEGQGVNSLIPSLNNAIKNGKKVFNVSKGDQIRDFIHVDKVADAFLRIADSPNGIGVINIGSGNPISIRDFLESYIVQKNSKIKLNLGFYPRRSDEPLAFWADCSKLDKIIN